MQNEGLAMGAPTSAILAETYIQHLEHTSIFDILNKHRLWIIIDMWMTF
jgi:hypothetical protein